MFIMCSARLPQGFFAKLLSAPGDAGECTSNGLYCFTGLPAKNAFEVFDVNADDKWSALYGADTRYGGGKGVAGKLWSLPRDNGCTWRSGCAWGSEMLRTGSRSACTARRREKGKRPRERGCRVCSGTDPFLRDPATPYSLLPISRVPPLPPSRPFCTPLSAGAFECILLPAGTWDASDVDSFTSKAGGSFDYYW
jgi:hypothetical protein